MIELSILLPAVVGVLFCWLSRKLIITIWVVGILCFSVVIAYWLWPPKTPPIGLGMADAEADGLVGLAFTLAAGAWSLGMGCGFVASYLFYPPEKLWGRHTGRQAANHEPPPGEW